MNNLYCESPVILVNHRLGYYLSLWKKYQTPTGVYTIGVNEASYYRYSFPQYKYTPKRFKVNIDNIDQYNVISPDGEIYPMYIAVPCGKCLLCRDKKKRDWSFRAVCENVYSISQPLFITLTYNNAHLPRCGVFKEELQMFMKRLRIKLDRAKIKHNIRYFAVGEYGSRSGRPHYHLIFWNFPTQAFNCITSVLHFIENAWKKPIIIDGQIQYSKNGAPKTESIGFALCKPCDKGAISYVMKYMRKEATLPSKDSLPVFFLSSRKNGGLGAQYARDHKDFYMLHPECLNMTVTDPYSGMEITQMMPAYFKRLYFPSNSTLIDKITRDAYKELCEIVSRRLIVEKHLQKLTCLQYKPTIHDYERKIFKKYWFLKQPMYFKPTEDYKLHRIQLDSLWSEFYALEMKSTYLCQYLAEISYDLSYVVNREKMLLKRQRSLDYFFGNKEDLNINDVKYRLYQALKLAESKEIL